MGVYIILESSIDHMVQYGLDFQVRARCLSYLKRLYPLIIRPFSFTEVESKQLRLVFVEAFNALYLATLVVEMRFGSLPIEQDQNEGIILKTRRVMVACAKRYR